MSEHVYPTYVVTIGGIPHTLQLSPADVERYGAAAAPAAPAAAVKAKQPANKAGTAANK